jgi:cytochrome c oxidase cbb3-type subunit I
MKAEVTPVDSSSSIPLLGLLFSGLLWLVASGALALVASVQLHTPTFLAGCCFLTYGHTSAMAETAFVYGWMANAGLALALWTVGRLAGEPLRGQAWALVGTTFWNLGVTGAVIGIAVGDNTGFALLGLPSYVQLVLFASYGAIAVSGILAWSGRLRQVSYASHWYAAAAFFLFPWLLSIAHVMLFSVPVRGVLQPIVAGWYAQSAWTLWLAPLALAAAYYVVPKVTGKVMPSYEFASLGFWCLIFVGGLTGGRHLVGGPVPAWIPSIAVVACALLLFHVIVVFLNLRGAFSGKGIALKFIAFGLAAYALGATVDALTSFHSVAAHTQFTYFDEAQRQLALYGAASMIFLGAIYYALPRITGKAWLSPGLVRLHLFLTVFGILLLLGSLSEAALVQSQDLLDPKIDFAEISHHTHLWLVTASVAYGVLLLASIAVVVNFIGTACRVMNISQPAVFDAPAELEVHAP